MGNKRGTSDELGEISSNFGGIFRGLGGFLDVLSNLAELGEINRSGEIGGENKKGLKAVYGVSVRVGGAGETRVEHFGNVKGNGERAVVEEIREPMVDIFDESDHLLVVAELPGVDANDINFELKDDILDIAAMHGDRKYRKEILLPTKAHTKGAISSYRNGVFELKLQKNGLS